jgi:hypothetical protein
MSYFVTIATAGQPATVVVYSPQLYTTVTTLYTGLTSAALTQQQTIQGGPITVLLQVPMQYITVTATGSGSSVATLTQFTPSVPGQTGTVLVQVPPLSTVTTTAGGVAFTSTSTVTVNGVLSQVAVVGVPVIPFHIYITDLNRNPLGYLTVANTATVGTAYNATATGYPGSSLYYFDSATGQLALSPSSGISA